MLSLRAPAKINWFLFVPGRRDDGYHEIISLMQCVDLYDGLTFEPFDALALESDCPIPAHENIVWKAALLLKEHSGTGRGARVRLEKNIPLEAGLGGGSSDAAFTLIGLNRLWGLGLETAELSALGAKLGSDVPFFINGCCSLATGRGEKIEPVDMGGKEFSVLIVKPEFGVSAGWAYRALRSFTGLTKANDNIKLFIRALREGELSALEGLGCNDLEGGVLAAFPEIGRIKAALKSRGARYVLMSGSGSSVFGVFPDGESARKAGEGIAWWCRSVRTICERSLF
ncbi:MAG: 4-(cytidine 5'-diphospho)-2-C-methyl-D-erythritol kinase [Nitrospiraceae bacterium]|nr:4-(cytidine 5'-diphospho)-2-C-methyl-D-erythritol kinase [Nitrospiraceae bacterium]